MRQFILHASVDPKTLNAVVTLVEQTANGLNTVFTGAVDIPRPTRHNDADYSVPELYAINRCNKILADKNLPQLSDEEIAFLLDPHGLYKRAVDIEQQLLADVSNIHKVAGIQL